MEDYIRKSVMENMPEPLQKQEDDDEDDKKQYESSDPMDWVDNNIDECWEEEDGTVIVTIESEGGEVEQVPISQAMNSVYTMFDDDTVQEIREEIEDMAD